LEALKTILIFSDWYYPGYKAGGPVQSVYNLASLLSKYYKVKIVTSIYDLNSSEPYPEITPDQWMSLAENQEVIYLDRNINTKSIKQIVKDNKYNYLLINGLFSFYFSVLPAFYAHIYKVRHTFIAVRGMLHASALSVKPFKKQIFLSFARGFGLYRSQITLLATSNKEKEEIQRSLGRVNIQVAPNIPLLVSEFKYREKNYGGLKILYLGRIAPEKNPMTLIQALKKIDFPCQVTFCGSGSLDAPYFIEFKNQLKQLPAFIKYDYIADIPHSEVEKLLNQVDVMVLPSLGENFGHAIFESFVHSVPVIIGNNTPWTGIEDKKAGMEIEPTNESQLAAALKRFNDMDGDTYTEWRKGAFEVANAYFKDNNFKEIYLRVFS
jgi:glycosyltransferase involved in cell wall biosynthesis